MTEKKKKKSVFSACCSCFSRIPIECSELTCPGFVRDIGDFEYIVENMSIKKIPKKFLNEVPTPVSSSSKNNSSDEKEHIDFSTNGDKELKEETDFSGYVNKEIPPGIWTGPIVEVEDASMSSSDNLNDNRKHYKPMHMAAPICMTCENRYSPHKRPGVAGAFNAETKHILDDTIKELLMPHATLVREYKTGKKEVIADVHESNVEEDKQKCIPSEIKETIEALKVARPLHDYSRYLSRNDKSIIQSASNTSCDKGTLCNLSNEKCILEEEKQKAQKARRYISPKKIDASSSTSDFQESADYSRNTSSDLQSSEQAEANDSVQRQSLKWKIIINKHKESI